MLILGSGNVVHNLGRMNPGLRDTGQDWAIWFDGAAKAALTESPGTVLDLSRHPDYERAVPTPDHFILLLYLAGLAQAAGRPSATLIDGYAYGSPSMTADTLDAQAALTQSPNDGAARLPETVPPEETNAWRRSGRLGDGSGRSPLPLDSSTRHGRAPSGSTGCVARLAVNPPTSAATSKPIMPS